MQIGEDTYGFHSVFKSVIEVNPNGIASFSPGFPNPGSVNNPLDPNPIGVASRSIRKRYSCIAHSLTQPFVPQPFQEGWNPGAAPLTQGSEPLGFGSRNPVGVDISWYDRRNLEELSPSIDPLDTYTSSEVSA